MTDKSGIPDIAAATVAHDGDLRDRIAYAIAQSDGDEPGMKPASCDYEMADAVIEELTLARDDEHELGSYTPSGRYRYTPSGRYRYTPSGRYRYVTDWITEETDDV